MTGGDAIIPNEVWWPIGDGSRRVHSWVNDDGTVACRVEAAPPPRRWTHWFFQCPRHEEVVLVAETEDGQNVTLSPGTGLWLSSDDFQEYVGFGMAPDSLMNAVAEPAPGDNPHYRIRIRCPRPSCNLDVQFAEETIRMIEDAIRALWKQRLDTVRSMVTKPWEVLG